MLGIKEKIIEWKLAKLVNKKSKRMPIPYSDSTSIGIVYQTDDQDKHDTIKKLKTRFEKDGKTVDVLTYLPKNKENYEFLFEYFDAQEVSFFGQFKSHVVEQFVQKPFNFLLVFDDNIHHYVKLIAAQSHAKCRVGFDANKNKNYLDLMLLPKKEDNKITNLADTLMSIIEFI